MTPVQIDYIKRESEKLIQAGYSTDDIVRHVMALPQFSNLLLSEKDVVALEIHSTLSSLTTSVAPRQASATLEPDFPVVQTVRGRGGRITELVVSNHPDNLKYLIRTVMGIRAEHNQLANEIFINGRMITDKDLGNIRNRCREYGLSDGKEFVYEVLEELAYESSYHPFLRAVDSTPWDGHDYITDLFNTLTLSKYADENREIVFQYLRRWLIAACNKVLKPGSQNLTLTFKSKQGDGKSRWIEKLVSIAPEIYGEEGVNPSDKDHALRHIKYIVWHIPEIDGNMRKSDAGLLKDYLTKAKVVVRKSYGRVDTVGYSILSFIASVNAEEFLVDDTGSRRFLVIELEDINPDHNVNVQQVWAQAMHLCRSGEKYYFDKDEIKTINEMNGSFQTTNHVNELVRMIEPGDDWLSGLQMFAYFLGRTNPTNTDMQKLGILLKKAKIECKRTTANGTKTMLYKVKKPEKPIF